MSKKEFPSHEKYKAQYKYDKKNNRIGKAFKVDKDLSKKFDEACHYSGESQSCVISRLMKDYVEGKI